MGTHFSQLSGIRDNQTTAPTQVREGLEYFDNTTNIHYIYAGGQWWGAQFDTTTSTSTTTTSTSSSTTTSTSVSTSTSSTTTSTSTTTTV